MQSPVIDVVNPVFLIVKFISWKVKQFTAGCKVILEFAPINLKARTMKGAETL